MASYPRGPAGAAAGWAALGLAGPLPPAARREAVQAVRSDPDPAVRSAALGALVRGGAQRGARAGWNAASADPAPEVRRRAAELAPDLASPPRRALVALLGDDDPFVAETAAWALGELGEGARIAVPPLSRLTTAHDDPLVRESAVAALGAIGDPRGLPAILRAMTDKPAVRRRAVLALAPFDGPDVERALAEAAGDRDWQVREAARTLSGSSG